MQNGVCRFSWVTLGGLDLHQDGAKYTWRIVGSMEETDRSGSYTCNYACDKKICNKRYIYIRNVRRREDVYLKRKKEYFMTMKIFVQLV